ncbi:MAG TPA: MOSC domain-containing protein [Chloroflexi bacterium]|nr:MOSC domain-containing protein [Chloroflexota bacterium]
MTDQPCHILGVFIGKTKTLKDARGEWQSSIARDRVDGPVQLEHRGFVGDQATQSYHGSPDIAVCLHSQTHYDFWNATLQMDLQPGGVGENLTLDTWDDSNLCVGDQLRIGTALIQISAPRSPCENQARFVGRPDWVKRTLEELRTGIYARVLEPGTVQAGDEVVLEECLNPGLTIRALNDCWYFNFDVALAERFITAEGLMAWWQQRFRDKVEEVNKGDK